MTSDGSAPTPTLSVGNVGGTITALCLAYQNLAQATARVPTTFVYYRDADGNPVDDPALDECSGMLSPAVNSAGVKMLNCRSAVGATLRKCSEFAQDIIDNM